MHLKWETCLKIGVTVFGIYLAVSYWPAVGALISALIGASAPLIIGCVIAYAVNILMSFYERHYFPGSRKAATVKSRRPVCMVGAFISLAAVLVAVVALVVPELANCVTIIIDAVTGVINVLLPMLGKLDFLPAELLDKLMGMDWQSKIGQLATTLLSGVGSVMDLVIQAVSSVFSGVITGFLGLIFSIYLLLSKENLSRQFRRLMNRFLPGKVSRKIRYVLAVLNDSFRRYFVGQCLEAVILGVLCAIGMLVLRLPYATMVGAVIAVTALIPVAGAYIGGAVGALMIFSVSPVQALVFLVYLLVLQQLEGNLIYPKVVGSSLGLPAIWVLAAVTLGGGIAGIVGMLLSVPLAATAYRLLKDAVNRPKKA